MYFPPKIVPSYLVASLLALSSCAGTTGVSYSHPPVVAAAVHATPTVLIPSPGLRTDTRPLAADLAQFRRANSARISPDGKHLAYVVRWSTFDASAKPKEGDHSGGWSTQSQIFIVSTKGGAPVQLTYGKESASSPRWSPDGGRIAFLRENPSTSKTGLHVISVAGGEAATVSLRGLAPQSFAWLANSQGRSRFAFTAVPPVSERETLAQWQRGGARKYDRDWRNSVLYTVEDTFGAEPKTIPFDGHIAGFVPSPNGQHFAITSSVSSNPYEMFNHTQVRVINGNGKVIATPSRTASAIGHVAWSPDGKYLAIERSVGTLSLLNELTVVEVANNRMVNIVEKLDVTLGGFVWSGRSIIAHVLHKTRSRLYRISRDGKNTTLLAAPGRVFSGLHSNGSGVIATISSTSNQPADPTVYDSKRGKLAVVASVNPQVKDWRIGTTRVVRWKNAEGVDIEGVFLETPHREGKAPLMVLPHGGPDSVSMESFSTWAHYFAARGYSVLRPNYRGGFGYGEAFYAANRGRLGAIEFADIESGVDALIASGDADPEQLFYGGWSWGGYISTWTSTKTKRYRAFVVGAGVVDTVAQYVTSDINHGVAADWEYRGRPWRKPESFARSNPTHGLNDIETPILIIHGESDSRVAFINGQTLYRALEDKGTEVEFYAYPREPHQFREPAHIVHMLTQWALWYDSHRQVSEQ